MTIRSPILALLLTLVTATGYAAGLSGSRFTVGAFGTLGALYQNARGLAFRRSVGQGHGARAGEIDFGTDSLLGLQLDGRVTADFDAQVQTVLRRNAAGVWRPELARAFLRYRPSPAVMVRAGRIGLGVYLLGSAVDVGYSYLTIRPPAEVYGLLASEYFDGADVAISRQIGAGVGRIRVLAGQLPYRIAMQDGSVITVPNIKIAGMTADYLYREWQTRAAFLAIHTPRSSDPVAAALARTGVPQAVELAGELDRSPQNTYAAEIGALYEGDPLQGALVLVHVDSDYLQGPKSNSGFAQIGYRIAQLTPYLALSMTEALGTAQRTGLPSLAVFEPLIAAAQEDQTAFQTTQRDLSLGVRYDIAPHMDVKAQIDRVWLHQSALVFDYNVPPPGHTALTLFGVALDFAF